MRRFTPASVFIRSRSSHKTAEITYLYLYFHLPLLHTEDGNGIFVPQWRSYQPQKGTIMEWEEIQTNWDTYKQDAKRTWPRLDDAELEVANGDRGKLIDKVRDAQSISHEEAEVEVDSWADNLKSA